ncbi:MAG: hypothetical protein WBE85_03540 [Methylocella sp.]
MNPTKTGCLLDPAVTDKTRPEGTGVNRLSSSLIHRVAKTPSPEAKPAATPPSRKLH